MKKYYIYLNGKQYMEMPKEYNIKRDIYMNYGDLINRYLKDRGAGAVAVPLTQKIEILSKFINEPQRTDMIIKHELTHIEQMQEDKTSMDKYEVFRTLLGHKYNPYEIEAKERSIQGMPLHRVGVEDIKYQKQLERWQKETPKAFRNIAEQEKIMVGDALKGIKYGMGREELVARALKQVQEAKKQIKKYGGEPEAIQKQRKWDENYLTPKAVEILRKRLEKFL